MSNFLGQTLLACGTTTALKTAREQAMVAWQWVASFLSNKRRCAIFAGAMGGGAIATAAFYGAIFCIFRNFLNFGRREKDILDVLGIPGNTVIRCLCWLKTMTPMNM